MPPIELELENITSARLDLISVGSIDALLSVMRNSKGSNRPTSRHQLTPLKNLATMLSELDCRAVIAQEPTLEKEYQAEFKAYYSTTFENYKRYSRRLHFFSVGALAEEDTLDFIDRVCAASASKGNAHQTEGYLGFVNVRPVNSSPIGRSVLVKPQKCQFLTVAESFRTTVAGNTLRVHGAPFMQQDSAVSACAHVAIWTALRVRRKSDGRDAVTIAEVASAVDGGVLFGPVLPTQGLSIHTIIGVLERFGYHGHNIPTKRYTQASSAADGGIMFMRSTDARDRIKELVYPYLESGIPVILLFKQDGADFSHAAVAVGHDWRKANITFGALHREIQVGENEKFSVLSPVNWINSLYVQDDSRGPYQAVGHSSKPYAFENVTTVIPVVPKDIYVMAEDCYPTAHEVIKFLFRVAKESAKEGNAGFQHATSLNQSLVVRPLLTSRHEFRRWAADNTSGALQRFYRRRHLPERLWVIEINQKYGYVQSQLIDDAPVDFSKMTRIGEILIDPTGDINDFPVLCAHVNFSAPGKTEDGMLLDVDSAAANIDFHSVPHPSKRHGIQHREVVI
jgi:hypothetical protein